MFFSWNKEYVTATECESERASSFTTGLFCCSWGFVLGKRSVYKILNVAQMIDLCVGASFSAQPGSSQLCFSPHFLPVWSLNVSQRWDLRAFSGLWWELRAFSGLFWARVQARACAWTARFLGLGGSFSKPLFSKAVHTSAFPLKLLFVYLFQLLSLASGGISEYIYPLNVFKQMTPAPACWTVSPPGRCFSPGKVLK